MLLRHTLVYSLSRGLAGALNLAAVMLFTRLLTPEEYGGYALAITAIGLANALCFHSVRMSLVRHYEAEEDIGGLLSTIFLWFHGFLIVIVVAYATLEAWWPGVVEQRTLWRTSLAYLWMLAWFELNLNLYRARLAPFKYGALFLAKHGLALGFSCAAVWLGRGTVGLMAGMTAGTALAMAVPTFTQWRGIRLRRASLALFTRLLRYGLPLTVTFATGYLVYGAGRIMLGWLVGVEAAGLYAVAYDITQQSILMLMTVVNLAAFPLAISKLERAGQAAAREQLARNAGLLLAASVPATVGLIMLGQGVVDLFLGRAFRDSAADVLPIAAVAAFLQGVKLYYVDPVFQLARKTNAQIVPVVLSVAVNLGLNAWWIPRWGIVGAAYAALAAYAVGLVAGIVLARRVFPLPFPAREAARIAAASGAMAIWLFFFRRSGDFATLALEIATGAAVYFAALFMLGAGGGGTGARRTGRSMRWNWREEEP
jgi:O-antigen/teichoic acid export membrane protein